MTYIKHRNISDPLVFDDSNFTTIQIENPHFLLSFMEKLQSEIESESDDFAVEIEGNKTSLSKKACLITDPLNVQIDEKKESNIIIKEISASLDDEMEARLSRINSEISDLISSLAYSYPVALECRQDLSIQSILKAVNITTVISDKAFLNRLLDELRIISHLYQLRIFFIYGLKSFLTRHDLELFIKECRTADIQVFLIESASKYDVIKGEKIIIIDKDLAELLIEEK